MSLISRVLKPNVNIDLFNVNKISVKFKVEKIWKLEEISVDFFTWGSMLTRYDGIGIKCL